MLRSLQGDESISAGMIEDDSTRTVVLAISFGAVVLLTVIGVLISVRADLPCSRKARLDEQAAEAAEAAEDLDLDLPLGLGSAGAPQEELTASVKMAVGAPMQGRADPEKTTLLDAGADAGARAAEPRGLQGGEAAENAAENAATRLPLPEPTLVAPQPTRPSTPPRRRLPTEQRLPPALPKGRRTPTRSSAHASGLV
eukprot:SAG22_NODE_4784_length_1164_cov_146.858216_1_plen_198_part_00